SYVSIVKALTVGEAVVALLRHEDPPLQFHPDGSVSMPLVRSTVAYPHPLAYIEAQFKINGEWQIRVLPEDLWERDFQEGVYCGEHPDEVRVRIERCRRVFRQDHPGSRARAFLWYLKSGALVTFYRRKWPWRIEVVGRYLDPNDAPHQIRPWTGTYEDLLADLWLTPFADEAG